MRQGQRPATQRLDEFIDMEQGLVRLSQRIDWRAIDSRFGATYADEAWQPVATRLMAGLAILKGLFDISDEDLPTDWIDNPYYQFFCGEETFQHSAPFDDGLLMRWRRSIGKDKLMALVRDNLAIADEIGVYGAADAFTDAVLNNDLIVDDLTDDEADDRAFESIVWVRPFHGANGATEKLPGRLKQLDKQLADLPLDMEPMMLSALDGFVAGIVVCPDAVPPAEWLLNVWTGEDGIVAPGFDRTRQAEKLARLTMEHHDAIEAALRKGRCHYAPVFDLDLQDDEVLWEFWIDGFEQAMELRPQSWKKLAAADEDTKTALSGLVTLAAINRDESPIEDEAESEDFAARGPNLIPICIETLHQWKLAQKLEGQPAAMPHFGKVGRNDPCPCGSGKKFKKCCGADA